jgi:hypothetical protein
MDELKGEEEEEEEEEELIKQKVSLLECDFKVQKLENLEEKLFKGLLIIIFTINN